jgi:hypothetical protein
MKNEHIIRVLAGTMVLLSVALVYFFGPWWLLLTGFVGINLIQSAFTGFCPPELLLRKLRAGEQGCEGANGEPSRKEGWKCCG